jgi:SAM-dependent methyltransferase
VRTEPIHLQEIRTSYDTVAHSYAELVRGGSDWEKATLSTFAERVLASGGRSVADLGCGPGRVTAALTSLGLDAFGIDLSPRMIQTARRDHPALRFDLGSMTSLDLPDSELGGALSWWSIVHTPPDILPEVFSEFARVLAPGGWLIVGFHSGANEYRRKETGYGDLPMGLYVYRHSVDLIIRLATGADLVNRRDLVEAPRNDVAGTPQACLLFHKPTS